MIGMMTGPEEDALAREHGFEPKNDGMRGDGWHSFTKGEVRVWMSRFWVRAELIDDRFRNHQAHETLEDALNGLYGVAYGPDSNPRQYASSVTFAQQVPLS